MTWKAAEKSKALKITKRRGNVEKKIRKRKSKCRKHGAAGASGGCRKVVKQNYREM